MPFRFLTQVAYGSPLVLVIAIALLCAAVDGRATEDPGGRRGGAGAQGRLLHQQLGVSGRSNSIAPPPPPAPPTPPAPAALEALPDLKSTTLPAPSATILPGEASSDSGERSSGHDNGKDPSSRAIAPIGGPAPAGGRPGAGPGVAPGGGAPSPAPPAGTPGSPAAAPAGGPRCWEGNGSLYNPHFVEKAALYREGPWRRAWDPPPGSFLLAWCLKGKASNRLFCMREHVLLAGLLQRVLLLPMHHNYTWLQMELVADLDHVRACFGPGRLVPLVDYLNQHGGRLEVHHLACFERRCLRNKRLSFVASKPRLARFVGLAKGVTQTHISLSPVASPLDFIAAFGSIGPGVLFITDPRNKPPLNEASYFRDKCPMDAPFKRSGDPACTNSLLFQPPAAIMEAAEGFARSSLADGYVALHLRRGDFVWYCQKKEKCYYPLHQVAKCLARQVARAAASVVYLATNGRPGEVRALRRSLGKEARGGAAIQVVMYSDFSQHKPPNRWAGLLTKHGIDPKNPTAAAAFDKVVCARARIFLGSPHSTFTSDIMRMRHGLGTATCADANYCGDEPLEP